MLRVGEVNIESYKTLRTVRGRVLLGRIALLHLPANQICIVCIEGVIVICQTW